MRENPEAAKPKPCDFPDEEGQYKVDCPKCGAKDCMEVIRFHCDTRIKLCPNGFAVHDAEHFDTDNEIVRCWECDAEMPLSELMVDGEAADADAE